MSDVQTVVVSAGVTICTVTVARAWLAAKLASIRASKAESAAEFVMMEKAAKPRKVKAHKSPAPIPFGL